MPGLESEPIENPEEAKPKERTKESEIKANVEFWQGLGVEVDEEDVRCEIEAIPEVEGFDWYHYIPKDVKNSEIWDKMAELFDVYKPEYLDQGAINAIQMPRTTEKAYAVASRYSQEPDKESTGDINSDRNIYDWEQTDIEFMSPLERMVAEIRYFQENNSHLDQKNDTTCPGSHIPILSDQTPIFYKGDDGSTCLGKYPPRGKNYPDHGVRRVITKDTKIE